MANFFSRWFGAPPAAGVGTITLTLADLADGTGMTATVSGNDAGTTVSLYSQRVDQGLYGSASTWTLVGTRTGPGSVTLALSPSYYWVYAVGTVSGGPAFSVPVKQVASREDSSVYQRILDAVLARVQSLSLTGLATPPGDMAPTDIEIVERIDSTTIVGRQLPHIFIAQNGAESQPGTTTAQDDIGYPVVIALFDRAPAEEVARFSSYRKWRQQIRRSLISQRLTGVSEMYFAELEPTPIFKWAEPAYDQLACALAFRFRTREPRGV